MKRYLLPLILLGGLLCAGAAQAQTIGQIGLYADASRETWCVSGTGFYQVEMYVWVNSTNPLGLNAVEFAIQYPANVAQSTITYTDNASVYVGNPRDGLSIAYNECEYGWHWALHQTLYVMNQDPSWAVVVRDPHVSQIIGADCTSGHLLGPLERLTNLCFNFCTSNFDMPFIMSVAKIDAQTIDVVFSEKVTPESAGSLLTYTLYDKSTESATLPILTALPAADSVTVRLSLGESLLAGRPYLLVARDVVSAKGVMNTSKKGFGDLPDLVFTTFSGPLLKNPCGPLNVTMQIKNQGVGAAGPFDVTLDWSADYYGQSHDAPLGDYRYSGLAPGATITENLSFAWPDTSTILNVVIGMIDSLDLMPESGESNNNGQTNFIEDYFANHLEVVDVPADQGKLVRFSFETVSTGPDVLIDPVFMQYDIQRRDPSGWTPVGTIIDDFSHKYYIDLPTLADSTESGGLGWSVFRVITTARRIRPGNVFQQFTSCPDSGYSVDNLAPTQPQGLWATMFDSGITLQWHANVEPDVVAYCLYRNGTPDFAPTPENRIAVITGALEHFDPDWFPGSGYCYKLTAKDAAGNESPPAGTIPDQYVATLLGGFEAALTDGAVEIAWRLTTIDEGGRFAVSRAAAPDGDFAEIESPEISRDRLSFLFVDRDIAFGEKYRYKVEYITAAGRQELFETGTIETPRLTLALHQNFPNPFNPSTVIRFDLPESGHVRLDVFDASGKLVATLVDKDAPSGMHAVEWNGTNAGGAQVKSGIYFYRLRTHEKSLTNKMVLLR